LPQDAAVCGWALALAHAKSGDAAMIAGYVGNSDELDQAMAHFAFAYDEQNEKDYEAFKSAVQSGRLQVAKMEEK
jgi:NAD(P)H-dependent flavin oxidoreductase YrpB (nitropropane dioxygenase family)